MIFHCLYSTQVVGEPIGEVLGVVIGVVGAVAGVLIVDGLSNDDMVILSSKLPSFSPSKDI